MSKVRSSDPRTPGPPDPNTVFFIDQMICHTLTVSRTARYFTLGKADADTREVWFVLHGYGQLASYFIRHFRAVDDGTRLIVAPEGLNRFYLGEDYKRIGATWMTKEDREAEIQDYLAYLNQVAAITMEETGPEVRVTVLGFSQGATTASRWVTLGGHKAHRLILWAGPIAHDIDLSEFEETLSKMKVSFVIGDKDHLISPVRVEEEMDRLRAEGIDFTFVPFEGTHQMNADVLKRLA